MRIRLAHLQDQGINFAVFAADATSGSDSSRSEVLARLTLKARQAGLRVEKSALAYIAGGRPTFYGTPDLVRYLAGRGVPQWTHSIDD